MHEVHAPDPGVPVSETLCTMDDLVRAGKIRYFGGGNMTGWEVQKYIDEAQRMGLSSLMATLQVKLYDLCCLN